MNTLKSRFFLAVVPDSCSLFASLPPTIEDFGGSHSLLTTSTPMSRQATPLCRDEVEETDERRFFGVFPSVIRSLSLSSTTHPFLLRKRKRKRGKR